MDLGGLSFRKRDDLLFCWVQEGGCDLIRSDCAFVRLNTDDFVLIRTSTPFHLISGDGAEIMDSEVVLKGSGFLATLGDGSGIKTILRGGKFVFDTANEELLTGLLPEVVHIRSAASRAERLRMLLRMNEEESMQAGPGSDFVITRLMELVLVEVLRGHVPTADGLQPGLIAGLADPITERALVALHREISRSWTTEKLARLCRMSRSSLASRFARFVGVGPMEYLQKWRIAIAKDELRRGVRSIGEIALAVGFQSGSAFSTAFTRATGCSPRRFADELGDCKPASRNNAA